MNDSVEAAGFALVLAFLWFCWPPLVLLGAGVLLVAWANTRTREARLGTALGAAIAAAKHAYVGGREEPASTPLRPVA